MPSLRLGIVLPANFGWTGGLLSNHFISFATRNTAATHPKMKVVTPPIISSGFWAAMMNNELETLTPKLSCVEAHTASG